MSRLACSALVLVASVVSAQSPAAATRPLRPSDLYRLRSVSDPQLSPDGAWVAYTVARADSATDKNDADVWMSSWDGSTSLRLTWTPDRESSPRWSPDGRYLAFLSGRQEGKGGQIWILDRRGGEAERVTKVRDGVDDYAWSPDSKRIALIMDEETDSALAGDTTEPRTPRPIVIDRFQFKRDVEGYLGTKHSHLAILTVASRAVETVTSGDADDAEPAWSPDGRAIAFVRTPTRGTDDVTNSDVWVVDAHAGATPRRLTDFAGPDDGPLSWSPDGRLIAFTQGDEPKWYAYNLGKVAVVPADGSAPARVLAPSFDRNLSDPRFAPDGRSVYAVAANDRAYELVRIVMASGAVDRVISGRRAVNAFTVANDGRIAALVSTPEQPSEVFAWDRATLRAISHQNDSLVASLQLASTSDFSSRSADGTDVHGIFVRPANAADHVALPTLLYIHGGPNGQDGYAFSFDRQLFAANGYAVLSVNYRGSNGRGSAYQKAIFGDWGNKEVMDLLGAVDEAVREGIADSTRLGVGGWSYGGILTDYSIASTTRFKAAISGAGSALQLSMYGHDEYTPQYDIELGHPWENPQAWMKVSYPFFHADRIKTPTLFLGGSADFNVPVIGGEQMYQALRALGVATELVIYPGQYHGITVPSYRVDRYQRYIAWYDRFVRGQTVQAGAALP